MTKFLKALFPIFALVLFVVLAAASCSFSTANIDSITLTEKIDDTTQEAIGTHKSSFDPNVGTIYASTKVTNAPSETKVKGEWFYNGTSIGSTDVEMDGTRFVGFKITKGLFDSGEYSFKASIADSDVSKEVNFSITGIENSGTDTDDTTDTGTDDTLDDSE